MLLVDTEGDGLERQIKRAVTDARAPTARMASGSMKAAVASAKDLTRYVEQQLPDVAEVGAVLKRMVERDGRLDRALDLNAVPKAIGARLHRRQGPPLHALCYTIPESWFAELGLGLPERFGVPVSRDGQ